MAFSFGFSGDDIEDDPNDVQGQSQQQAGEESNGMPPPIPAKTHDLDELLSTLPSKISFSTLVLTSPSGHTTTLPRRDLFDVRLQLMAEDDGLSATPLCGLADTDLQQHVYEGGYKTWECSLDLVRYLLDHGLPRNDNVDDDMARMHHVIEMGCGSALPTLVLWQHAIRNAGLGMSFTLTDYNEAVLRCVTVPNLLLAWVACLGVDETRDLFPEGANPLLLLQSSNSDASHGRGQGGRHDDDESADLYITPALISAFKASLASLAITTTLVSGSWSPTSSLLPLIPSSPALNTLILGSETIYSPVSLAAFADAIVALMARVNTGKTLVAAKRVYFGVGGGVDAFTLECSRRGCVASEVKFEGLGDGGHGGVRRCLVEVQMY